MLLAGCATTAAGPGVHAGDTYAVKTDRALFYTYGPNQANGPDFALGKGQRVTMLSFDYGYSHVAIGDTGQTGYVPTDSLAPAPPLPPSPALASSHTHHHHIADEYESDAPIDESQIPLPTFYETLPPPGAPPFRY
jgi:hypothetical protein